MGAYFKEEKQKKTRWESGQAILHRETMDADKIKHVDTSEKDSEVCGLKNSYGRLHYLKKGDVRGQEKEGFSLEAIEAPGTPLHTEKEKHLERASMKNIIHGSKRMLYASEVPLHNQALFYDLSDTKKSRDFLKCMKQIIHTRGHRTLTDAFGFLDQEPERAELCLLKEQQNNTRYKEAEPSFLKSETTMQTSDNKRMDALNGRLLRKEAKERQLCSELQLMLSQYAQEKKYAGSPDFQADDRESQTNQKSKNSDTPWKRFLQPDSEIAETTTDNETDQPEDI